jgi:hypothetical protein
MRGQAWDASGAQGMVIHKDGDTPQRSANDIRVSVSYGDMAFKAFISPELLRQAAPRAITPK